VAGAAGACGHCCDQSDASLLRGVDRAAAARATRMDSDGPAQARAAWTAGLLRGRWGRVDGPPESVYWGLPGGPVHVQAAPPEFAPVAPVGLAQARAKIEGEPGPPVVTSSNRLTTSDQIVWPPVAGRGGADSDMMGGSLRACAHGWGGLV
jgi:hypothetical protein